MLHNSTASPHLETVSLDESVPALPDVSHNAGNNDTVIDHIGHSLTLATNCSADVDNVSISIPALSTAPAVNTLLSASSNRTDSLCHVWIVGHSYIHWAHQRASERVYGSNLGLRTDQFRLWWFGKRGMSWFELRKALPYLYLHCSPPGILIFHLSGNDIGHRKMLDIIYQIKFDLFHIHSILPNTILVFF